MPRAVAEWRSDNPDAKVPARVRLRIWHRQCGDANFAICVLSGLPIRDTDKKHLHHVKALILGGEHRETNLAFVHASANLEQAKAEVAEKAKTDAVAKRHLGLRSSQTALAGRDRATRKAAEDARRADRTPVGKPPVPRPYMPPGFVPATER